MAPNETVLSARVLAATVVDATTLGMEPPQPILVLTLEVLSARGDALPRVQPGTPLRLEVLTKDTALAATKGSTITASVSQSGGPNSPTHYWLIRVQAPSSSR